eukprot:CAMPEP_0118697304 /NCGR_PEP_ID=MMETSP0800-20121206/14411_1 /TAXON_ID=210618 ORGANISM="Striatella unipunctata, Strain CCMP2910" /NCGR_SAMPLE_ID=MMETSP0800 /ASSEMBLY_ACC=CAM_ASM_000638 /LENGTH=138 /DNA_ID=CAMNT_0006596679 /DNA_START=128 /DNA_END=544 /DNA_ORIENTATION=-
MKFITSILFATLCALALSSVVVVDAFGTPSKLALSGVGGGSTFVTSQKRQCVVVEKTPLKGSMSMMGGKKSKFGIFSPAVIGAKVVLGDNELKKIRAKAIGLHSGAIGDFCSWAGASHMRTPLIKKAKENGDTLGFLV